MRAIGQLLKWAAAAAVLLVIRPAASQVVELDMRNQVFYEPSPNSHMTVINPAGTVTGFFGDDLTLRGRYSADIVSGASEAVKAGPQFADTPDIISRASVTDFRNVGGGDISLQRPHSHLSAGYTYGIENDYRSNALQVSAGTDFFQRNTEVEIAYSRGFDGVCDRALNARQDPTRRLALDSSDGCFTNARDRRTLDITIDNFHAAWTQTWTPVLVTQVVFTGSLQQGFLANPYRSVVIGPSGEMAQEHHPGHRNRTALAVRAKYFARAIETAFGIGARGYRDTWDIMSQAYEADAERNLLPWLRLRVHGRYYKQTAAVFWSDDYTGGEPATGPRGQYFSGDRELSPLWNLLGGGRVTADFHGSPEDRIGKMFLDLEASGSFDVMKTFLQDFTWAGRSPNDTLALIGAVSVTGTF